MKNITPSDLKSVLHSKRANIYFLEHCRVLVKGGRVEYASNVATCPDVEHLLTEEARLSKHLFRLAAVATRYGDFKRVTAPVAVPRRSR